MKFQAQQLTAFIALSIMASSTLSAPLPQASGSSLDSGSFTDGSNSNGTSTQHHHHHEAQGNSTSSDCQVGDAQCLNGGDATQKGFFSGFGHVLGDIIQGGAHLLGFGGNDDSAPAASTAAPPAPTTAVAPPPVTQQVTVTAPAPAQQTQSSGNDGNSGSGNDQSQSQSGGFGNGNNNNNNNNNDSGYGSGSGSYKNGNGNGNGNGGSFNSGFGNDDSSGQSDNLSGGNSSGGNTGASDSSQGNGGSYSYGNQNGGNYKRDGTGNAQAQGQKDSTSQSGSNSSTQCATGDKACLNGKDSTDKFSVNSFLQDVGFSPDLASTIENAAGLIPGVGLAETGIDAAGALVSHITEKSHKATSTALAAVAQATSTQVASQGYVQNYSNNGVGGASSGGQNNVGSNYRRYTADR